jgi:hypothetical protein
MFTVSKAGPLFQLHCNEHIIEGNIYRIIYAMRELGVDIDEIYYGMRELVHNERNVALYGVNRTFICTKPVL